MADHRRAKGRSKLPMTDYFLFEQLPAWLGRYYLILFLFVTGTAVAVLMVMPRVLQSSLLREKIATSGGLFPFCYRIAPLLLIFVVLGLASLYGFFSLVDELLEWEELEQFDRSFSLAVQQHAILVVTEVFSSVTWLGGTWVLISLGIFTGAVLMVFKQWIFLLWWIVAVAGGNLLNYILKLVFERARPEVVGALAAEGWSFPSGHAAGAILTYGMAAYLLVSLRPAHYRMIAATTAIAVLMVGASRIYLGAHYVSDVLAGYSVGIFWLLICMVGCEIMRSKLARQSMEGEVNVRHPPRASR